MLLFRFGSRYIADIHHSPLRVSSVLSTAPWDSVREKYDRVLFYIIILTIVYLSQESASAAPSQEMVIC